MVIGWIDDWCQRPSPQVELVQFRSLDETTTSHELHQGLLG